MGVNSEPSSRRQAVKVTAIADRRIRSDLAPFMGKVKSLTGSFINIIYFI
jgi:hypothetical protein